MPREGKFEACIPKNHGKREFPLTPGWERQQEKKIFFLEINFFPPPGVRGTRMTLTSGQLVARGKSERLKALAKDETQDLKMSSRHFQPMNVFFIRI